jgi:hypothetical protein
MFLNCSLEIRHLKTVARKIVEVVEIVKFVMEHLAGQYRQKSRANSTLRITSVNYKFFKLFRADHFETAEVAFCGIPLAFEMCAHPKFFIVATISVSNVPIIRVDSFACSRALKNFAASTHWKTFRPTKLETLL